MVPTTAIYLTLGQSGSGSNGNEGVHHIPQNSITGVSPSDCFVSYSGHSLEKSYPFAEIGQSAGAVEYIACISAKG